MDELAVFLSYVLNEKIPVEHLEDILKGKSEYEFCIDCAKGYREAETLALETILAENQKAHHEGDLVEMKEMIDDVMDRVDAREMEIRKIKK